MGMWNIIYGPLVYARRKQLHTAVSIASTDGHMHALTGAHSSGARAADFSACTANGERVRRL